MTTASATSLAGFKAVAETGAAGGSRGLLRAMKDHLLYRRTLAELRALDDRELADLGISRFALPEIARQAVRGR
ncbi:DUF1127 domain-containing protein [Amaricoccus solimangrovi]|uniref:DUF1127 domain-containing protein n=1 Tax=Amaricoccus solimangrovi TaxID=2589815 RepID=A0A501WIH2_9RHOB|nr:DUF1127 domain-containing protein [Amaricoccus solimangrovi]TPE49683.1 DUF1127 domain-containing protein [Amaricoccus solimangrovi]